MAKAFTVASWNVEHFKDDPTRITRVVEFFKKQSADVFAVYEVEGKTVYQTIIQKMPDYQFHITEGPQVQEILVGARKTVTAFFTQKIQFKRGNTYLRPGALLSVRVDGHDYSVLFLHTKSSTKPVGLGIRDDMFDRAFKFRGVLDKAAPQGRASYIFLGDLNTMGMEYPFQKDIAADLELQKLDREARKVQMRRLKKRLPTWWDGTATQPSDLDHVLATNDLTFKLMHGADVAVRGWPELPTDEQQRDWIAQYSDHALLFFQVEKV